MSERGVKLQANLVHEFRQRLRDAREHLFRTIATTDEELKTLEAHQPGAPGEDASTDTAAALLSRLEGRERHELDEIYAAQARLETGTFGVCDVCHRSIPLARLRVMPAARLCVACRSREDERG